MFQCPLVMVTYQEKDYSNVIHYVVFILKINLYGKKMLEILFEILFEDLPAVVIFIFQLRMKG